MGIRKSEHGFTFISILLSIMILFMTLPFVAHLVKSANVSSYYHEISVQQFFQFIRDDFIQAASYEVEQMRITFTLPDGTETTIEKYKGLIRRQVDGQGHEIYVRDIEDVSFSSLSYGINATFTSRKGDEYEKTIVFYP